MAATRDDVLSALARVSDPASGKNIVDAGLVQGLVLRDGHVRPRIPLLARIASAVTPL